VHLIHPGFTAAIRKEAQVHFSASSTTASQTIGAGGQRSFFENIPFGLVPCYTRDAKESLAITAACRNETRNSWPGVRTALFGGCYNHPLHYSPGPFVPSLSSNANIMMRSRLLNRRPLFVIMAGRCTDLWMIFVSRISSTASRELGPSYGAKSR
jgi:hypothetical protein